MKQDVSLFHAVELKRVGTAATMLVVCGTVVILGMTMLLGHYNSLAHSGPKAAVDGAVIALLIGRRGRWRCLSLLGVVYGLVLLLQVGLFYLLPVTMLAAIAAAGVGRAFEFFNRSLAVVLAAITYELLAGFGASIKIFFGTGGKSEPFLWALWFAEWPLRIIGAAVGVWLVGRWVNRAASHQADPEHSIPLDPRSARVPQTAPAMLSILACFVACTLPMMIESTIVLAGIAAIFLLYAILAGVRRQLVHAMLGLFWGWMVFAICSYAWNRDPTRVLDLGRTLVLRFAPMTFAATVIVTRVRAVELLRLLRRWRISSTVLIPLSSVLRNIPQVRLAARRSIQMLRRDGHWTGPFSLLRHPIIISKILLAPHFARWARELSDEPSIVNPPR